jgi:hypothetical protein
MLSPILMLAAAQAALFPAQKLAPPTSIERDAQRRTLDLIRETYSAYYNSTISHHFFVRLAPSTLQHELSKFVWNDDALKAVRSQFPAGAFVVPDVYHEIYVMRPEIDFLDADKKHFDGPKVPGLTTLRSLIYLEGPRARFVAETSGRNYTTDEGSTIVLDFYRELHHVRVNGTAPRVIIKAAIHVLDAKTPMNYLKIAAHRLIFFCIKAVRGAFESSESPLLMLFDNAMRSMNKSVGPWPLVALVVPLVLILIAQLRFPLQTLPYAAHVLAVCLLELTRAQRQILRTIATGVALGRVAAKGYGWTAVLSQATWLGLCLFMEANSDMARRILFAPIPNSVELDTL